MAELLKDDTFISHEFHQRYLWPRKGDKLRRGVADRNYTEIKA
jgi:hypothetical protein